MFFLRITAILITVFLTLNCFANTDNKDESVHHKINFLPDGTQVKFENDKVFYVCNKKLKPMPSGRYMLADGTVIKVKLGTLVSDRYKYQRPSKEKSEKRAEKAKKQAKKEKLSPRINKD